MQIPQNPKEVREFAKDFLRDGSLERSKMATYAARNRSYYIGLQWIAKRTGPSGFDRWTREATNWVASQNRAIRATVNRVTRSTIQVAAATNPEQLWVDAFPPDHAEPIEASRLASIVESVANKLIEDSGILRHSRRANYERTVAGLHGIGLTMDVWPEQITDPMGRTIPIESRRLKAFEFDATRMTLEQSNHSHNLRDHDVVMYTEVFTENALRRMFGQQVADIDSQSLKTIAALLPTEMQFNELTGGAMYASYAKYAHTRGALVHFAHFRSPSGRYDVVFPVIEARRNTRDSDESIVINADDPRSPWAGDGLPYAMLYGHFRPLSRMPISDVGMMIDDQDRLNLLASLYLQQLYNWTQYAHVVDRRWFGRMGDNEIREAMRMQDIIGPNTQGVNPPQIMQKPAPSATLSADMDRSEAAMREQVFRTESHQGRLKSHVTTTQFTGTMELSQIPLDDRVATDIEECYGPLIRVLTATGVANLQRSSPCTARLFKNAGLSAEDLGLLATVDTSEMPTDIVLRQETVRRRSRSQKKQDLLEGVQIGAISPRAYARAMASNLDMPLSAIDKQASRFAQDTAFSVLYDTEPFQPVPMGEHTDFILEELRLALMSPSAKKVPGARQRLIQAIISQMEMQSLEAPPATGDQPAGAAEPAQPEMPEAASIAQMFDSLRPADALAG